MFVVDNDGRAGGLVLFYHKVNKIQLNFVSSHAIDIFFMPEDVVQWRFMVFYGHPALSERHMSWDDICNLHKKSDHPWLF